MNNTVNISGGKIDHSNITAGNNTTANTYRGSARSPTVEDLSRTLRDAHGDIVAAGTSQKKKKELAEELREILQSLDSGHPEAVPVRSRWARIQRVLGPVTVAGSVLAEVTGNITKMVTVLFGTP